MHTRESLTEDFRVLGLRPGDLVMVHASIRAVGAIAGGPDVIHLALKDAITATGALMMYAGCPAEYDEVGRGRLDPEAEAELMEKLPSFDPETARCDRENGALVELFRTYPGSRVNPHVVRFVAWGAKTDRLFEEQPWNYAYGRGSALDKLKLLDGRILLLGCDHDTVTFLHHVEHVIDIDGRRVVRYRVPLEIDGQRVWREIEEFDTSSEGTHPHWTERFFAEIVDSYLTHTANAGGQVGDARCHLLQARGLAEFASNAMRAVASDRSASRLFREFS